jgi:hypothetical protein
MTIDIKYFYLNTPMETYEYMRIPVRHIPATIMTAYKLADKIYNGHAYVEIRKGVYGLPHAGKIANDRLVKHLNEHGYQQAEHTYGLFTHMTRKGLIFLLVVDNLGVQYTSRIDTEHLIATLKRMYEVTTDWTGTKYLGLMLAWDYKH